MLAPASIRPSSLSVLKIIVLVQYKSTLQGKWDGSNILVIKLSRVFVPHSVSLVTTKLEGV